MQMIANSRTRTTPLNPGGEPVFLDIFEDGSVQIRHGEQTILHLADAANLAVAAGWAVQARADWLAHRRGDNGPFIPHAQGEGPRRPLLQPGEPADAEPAPRCRRCRDTGRVETQFIDGGPPGEWIVCPWCPT